MNTFLMILLGFSAWCLFTYLVIKFFQGATEREFDEYIKNSEIAKDD